MEENVIFGGHVPVDVTKGFPNLGDFVIQKLRQQCDGIAVINGKTLESLSYKDILHRSLHLASCLENAGVTSDDVVGILSENCLEFPIISFACFYLGAKLFLLNVNYKEGELRHALSLASPKYIFAAPQTLETLVAVSGEGTISSGSIISLGNKLSADSCTTYQEFISRSPTEGEGMWSPKLEYYRDQVTLIACSSGTTGLPKGVQLTQENILAFMSYTRDITAVSMPDYKKKFLLVLPCYHTFGFSTLIRVICGGHTLIILPKFDGYLFLNCLERYRISIVVLVPPLVQFLAKNPWVNHFNLSHLKEVVSSGAALSDDLIESVTTRLRDVCVRQVYGMTETTIVLISSANPKRGSIGSVQYDTWAKVVDPTSGKALGVYQHGELCFRGPLVMLGYIGNEAATQATIRDGWLHTGDLGYYDEDQLFYLVGRLKELIKYKGNQVSPSEIENVLFGNDNIKDVAVIGLPDPVAGELPAAFVVRAANSEITEKDVVNYVAGKLSPAKRLHFVFFVNEIPKSPTGKILRNRLLHVNKISKL